MRLGEVELLCSWKSCSFQIAIHPNGNIHIRIMDPLTIFGGIAAIGQVTGTVIKYAEIFYQISYKAGLLIDDVEFFAHHVNVFGSTISGVHNTISAHYKKSKRSPTLQRLHEHSVLMDLANMTKRLMRRVETLQPRLQLQKMKLGLLGRYRWITQDKERKEVCMWMDRVGQSFSLIMHQVLYEALEQRASEPTASMEEKSDLRKEM